MADNRYIVGIVLLTLLSMLATDFIFPDINQFGFICCVAGIFTLTLMIGIFCESYLQERRV